ncbi:MAG: hypothetical protein QM622_06025 [Microbacterium sp.]
MTTAVPAAKNGNDAKDGCRSRTASVFRDFSVFRGGEDGGNTGGAAAMAADTGGTASGAVQPNSAAASS